MGKVNSITELTIYKNKPGQTQAKEVKTMSKDSVLDRLAKVQAKRPKNNFGSRVVGLYHNWKDGTNRIRLVGDFVEVHTHFIAPAPKRKDRGLCQAEAFKGDDRIPMVVNCLDWDIANEKPTGKKVCPICKLHAIAVEVLKLNPNETEKKEFELIKQATRVNASLKWNIISRDDPYVVEVDENGKETKMLGYKIATFGREAQTDVFGIYKQIGFDIQDPEKGIDIEINKDSTGARVSYTARAVIEGMSVKATPLTKEEKEMELHDLKIRCGRIIESEKIVDALHEDLADMLEVDSDTDIDTSDVESALDDAVSDVEDQEAIEEDEDDNDDMLSGTKKK